VAVSPPSILARQELAEWRWENPTAYSNLSKFESPSLAIRLAGDGPRINGVGFVSELDEAKVVHRYLLGWTILPRRLP